MEFNFYCGSNFATHGKQTRVKNCALGCVPLGNLDFFKTRISDLQSTAKSENGFQRLRCLFLDFLWEIRKRIWKTVLKNSGLARARIISKKKTAVHKNNFANPFFDFPIERYIGNPWNPDSHFLIEILPDDWGEIYFQILRSIAKSEIQISQSNATLVSKWKLRLSR